MLIVKKNNSNNLLEEHKVKSKSLPPSPILSGNNYQQFFGHPLSCGCVYVQAYTLFSFYTSRWEPYCFIAWFYPIAILFFGCTTVVYKILVP